MKARTYGEKYGPAMAMESREEAAAYFEECVLDCMSNSGSSRAEAEVIERQNLAYWAGYYDHETRCRVERLFQCEHPLLGPASAGPLSPDEAFRAGVEFARGLADEIQPREES